MNKSEYGIRIFRSELIINIPLLMMIMMVVYTHADESIHHYLLSDFTLHGYPVVGIADD